MCGSSSSSPHSCSRVIFANASQAAGFSTRSSEGEGRGGGWKRTEDGKGRGFDSPVVSFFSPPWLAPYQATFFSQLFNDERASRRRCCLSSAVHKSCAKLARRTPSAFFPPPSTYDSARRKSTIPGETSTLYLFPRPSQLYDSFPRA